MSIRNIVHVLNSTRFQEGVSSLIAAMLIPCNRQTGVYAGIYIYNILSLSGGRPPPFHPSVPLSIHPSSSSQKKKMMEEEEDDDKWR